MKNVSILNDKNGINLVDSNGVVLFSVQDWEEVFNFAEENDLNIRFTPKDLVFDIDPKCPDGAYVFFDIKYGEGGYDDLGSHNIINLPDCMDSVEVTECTFLYDESISEKQVIADLVALGATYKKFL